MDADNDGLGIGKDEEVMEVRVGDWRMLEVDASVDAPATSS